MTNQDYAAEQQARAFAAEQLQAVNPHLVPAGNNPLIAASKNIRIELKAKFPGVKFSIKTSRYSGGDSINIYWTDGPTTDQVESISRKYKGGHFDGMTDCYNSERNCWTDAFGDAMYVFAKREYSDLMVGRVMNRVCRHLGGLAIVPTVEDYRKGRIWSLRTSGGCDVAHYVNTALSNHTFCVGK